MAHLTINKKEIFFLRENILKRYCHSSGQDYNNYCQNITGTIKYYETIREYIQEEVNNHSKLLGYANLVSDIHLKNYLKNNLLNNDIGSRRFLRDLINSVSANVLRKLIFNGPDEEAQKYKDSFIQVCYIYLEIDRNKFLKNISNNSQINTIDILRFEKKNTAENTTHSFLDNPPICSLKPLYNNREEIDIDKPILVFEGKNIELNRNNLDKSNNTITSKIQAELRFEDGEWIIVNHSQLKTTFIQVVDSIKIKKGDIIVLGNRRFLFDG